MRFIKAALCCIAAAVVFTAFLPAVCADEGTVYNDDETGAEFTVPDGWTEETHGGGEKPVLQMI